MKNGSHSRHTYPYDKGVPKESLRQMAGYSEARQTCKKLQKRKARKANKALCKMEIE